jgi:uncharacterized protein
VIDVRTVPDVPSETDRLFAQRDPLVLAGSRCTACGTVTFPIQPDCPRCTERTMAPIDLPPVGTLWTWTVQTFAPRPPFVTPANGFEPFCLGYVDLGDVVIETRIDAQLGEFSTGDAMHLVPWTWDGPDGTELAGYAFAPSKKVHA